MRPMTTLDAIELIAKTAGDKKRWPVLLKRINKSIPNKAN
jgi:hypothetical protein